MGNTTIASLRLRPGGEHCRRAAIEVQWWGTLPSEVSVEVGEKHCYREVAVGAVRNTAIGSLPVRSGL